LTPFRLPVPLSPLSPGVSPFELPQPAPQNQRCKCPEERKEKKKRKDRTICYRGSYRERRKGLNKRRRERIPCE
jgi:hypothetical protein